MRCAPAAPMTDSIASSDADADGADAGAVEVRLVQVVLRLRKSVNTSTLKPTAKSSGGRVTTARAACAMP